MDVKAMRNAQKPDVSQSEIEKARENLKSINEKDVNIEQSEPSITSASQDLDKISD